MRALKDYEYIYMYIYTYIYDEDEHVKVLVRVLQSRLCCSAWKDFFGWRIVRCRVEVGLDSSQQGFPLQDP